MKVPALLLLVLCCSYAEEAALPPNIQSIITKAERAVAKNRSVYDATNEKAFVETEKSLKAELERLTKAGKLDEAVAVKKLLETFRSVIIAKVDAAAKSEPQILLPAGDDPLVGKWGMSADNAWEFKSDGTGTRWSPDGNVHQLKWSKGDAGCIRRCKMRPLNRSPWPAVAE